MPLALVESYFMVHDESVWLLSLCRFVARAVTGQCVVSACFVFIA